MEIYRGPRSIDFDAFDVFPTSQHKLVARTDFSESLEPWTGSYRVEANITKDRAGEREAVANIIIDEDDVISLYQALMRGREEKLHAAEEKLTSHDETLKRIVAAVGRKKSSELEEPLSKIISIATDALKME